MPKMLDYSIKLQRICIICSCCHQLLFCCPKEQDFKDMIWHYIAISACQNCIDLWYYFDYRLFLGLHLLLIVCY